LIADADGNVREIFYDDNGRQTGTRFYHYPTDQRPPTEASGIVHPVSAYPPKRTRLETKNVLDASGSVLTSFTQVMPQTFDVALKVYKDDLAAPEVRNEGSLTQYDALGRAYRTIDENGRVTVNREGFAGVRPGIRDSNRTTVPGIFAAFEGVVTKNVYDGSP
jgi:hypothetical protein